MFRLYKKDATEAGLPVEKRHVHCLKHSLASALMLGGLAQAVGQWIGVFVFDASGCRCGNYDRSLRLVPGRVTPTTACQARVQFPDKMLSNNRTSRSLLIPHTNFAHNRQNSNDLLLGTLRAS